MFPCPAAQGFTLRYVYVPPSGEWITEILPCPELHSAQGFTLRYVYVPPSGEWVTVILPCPGLHSAQGYTLCYVYVPLSGEWITEILPCPGFHPALWVCSPFRGMGYGDSAQGAPCDMGIIPIQGNGLWEWIYRNFDSLEFYKRLINS